MPRQYKRRMPKKMITKAKRVIAKTRKSKAKKNMDTFFLRARTQSTLIPLQGVSGSNYLYRHFALLSPTDPLGVTQIPEFNLYRVQYDKVRVNSVHVKITPKANVLDSYRAQNETAFNVSGSGVYHTAIDRDNAAPSNVAAIQRYSSYKKYSLLKGMSRVYSIKYPANQWLDCSNVYGSNTALQLIGYLGGITVYAENLPEDVEEVINEPWAQVEVFYNCVFQGKTSGSLTVDCDTGAVTITPHDTIVNLPFSPLGAGTQTSQGCSGQVHTTDEQGNSVVISDRGDHATGPTGPI